MLATPESKRTSLPGGFDAIIAPVEDRLDALTAFLEDQTGQFEEELRELVAYCLRNQGKRIRPVLVFFGGWPAKGEAEAALVQAAAVIELVHLATLVHDDILDDATLRHNSDTVSARWGTAPAVLLGDALFSQALKLAAEFPTVEVCREVSLATRRVCAGEIRQTFERGNTDFPLAEYFRVIELKTAELFRVSCHLGARLAGYDEDCAKAAGEFGRRLGIAYQIYDDVADVAGEEAKIGKTLGTDLASGKFTLPTLLLMQKGHLTRQELTKIAGNGSFDASGFLARLEQHGIIGEVERIFDEHLEAAEAALRAVEPRYPPAKHLLQLSGFVRAQMARYTR